MTELSRRSLMRAAGALAALGLAPSQARAAPAALLGPPVPFDADMVVARARALAALPYTPPPPVSAEWVGLTYDQFRGIWFDGRYTLFRDRPGAVQAEYLIAGTYFGHKIALNAVEAGFSQPIGFSLDAFGTKEDFPVLPADGTGYAGFRLLGELEDEGLFQEYAVFQGASYFRAIARGQAYGLSARGLALNTGGRNGEEFPTFREFWIEAAPAGEPWAVVHALLDSPSVAGAYSFRIAKGEVTQMDVASRLFPRVDLAEAGIAPATSMFLYSDLNRIRFDDFREAVHDSDGLLMLNGAGEALWRPLSNPRSIEASAFADSGPRGFGLMQRARRPGDYNDLEANYDRRPSLWVEPAGDWGAGSVMLIEIPSDGEWNDNIVAFWRPEVPLAAGQEHAFDYTLHWCAAAPAEGFVAPVVATRTGARIFEEGRIFTIDFGRHPALGDDPSRVEVRVNTGAGEVASPVLHDNPATGGMRLDFTLRGDPAVAELRAELWRGGQRAAEVWVHRWVAG